ncbi:MAG: DUF1893 domain-containing protein [Oscillospiraceae bacterium]|nr:DUF1893 domain-containing protein [Oscillospiraceae bacterium]
MNGSSEKAKKLLVEKTTFVLINGETVRVSEKSGIAPIMELLAENPEIFKGAYAADRVTGRAAALLLAFGRIKELYTALISRAAVSALEENGVAFFAEREVLRITDRSGTGLCPMEEAVMRVSSPGEAYGVLRKLTGK